MKNDILGVLESGDYDSRLLENLYDSFSSHTAAISYLKFLKLYYLARNDKKMTIEEVARCVGVAPMTIKRIENLQVVPNVSTLFGMLSVVGIDLDNVLLDDINIKGFK